MDNGSLEGFTKLATFASVFSGTNKVITDNEFPYHIFDPCCETISNISGFFSHVTGTPQETVKLPGTLFTRCTNLTNISSCFSYFGIDFELTPNGFINCHKLSNVSSLFTYTTHALNYLPNHFFNVGFIDSSVDLIGAQINQQVVELPEDATITDARVLNTEYLITFEQDDNGTPKQKRDT